MNFIMRLNLILILIFSFVDIYSQQSPTPSSSIAQCKKCVWCPYLCNCQSCNFGVTSFLFNPPDCTPPYYSIAFYDNFDDPSINTLK